MSIVQHLEESDLIEVLDDEYRSCRRQIAVRVPLPSRKFQDRSHRKRRRPEAEHA